MPLHHMYIFRNDIVVQHCKPSLFSGLPQKFSFPPNPSRGGHRLPHQLLGLAARPSSPPPACIRRSTILDQFKTSSISSSSTDPTTFSVAGGLERGTFEDREELRQGLVHTVPLHWSTILDQFKTSFDQLIIDRSRNISRLVPAGLKRRGTLVAGGLERGALEDREELRQGLVHREVRL